MWLQPCLDGSHRPEAGRPVPVAPAELAAAARDAVTAGADDVHVHPKAPGGADDLSPEIVGAAVETIVAAVPAVQIGVTTDAWAAASPSLRHDAVQGWGALPSRPDVASVNWHEEGSPARRAAAGAGDRRRGRRVEPRRRAAIRPVAATGGGDPGCSSRRPPTTGRQGWGGS